MGKVIGITGQSGAGKTTATRYLQGQGYPVIDADIVAREVVQPGKPCLDDLVQMFSEVILLPSGELDRKKLGNIVFSDLQKLDKLNKTMHPYILESVEEKIEYYQGLSAKYVFLDAPTLFESGVDVKCDFVISVIADKEKRILRIMKRDKLSREEAIQRIEAQHDDEYYIAQSNFWIENGENPENMFIRLQEILSKIGEEAND